MSTASRGDVARSRIAVVVATYLAKFGWDENDPIHVTVDGEPFAVSPRL